MLSDETIIRNKDRLLPVRAWLKLRKFCSKKKRDEENKRIREILGNRNFTIFSNNCTGGVFYHDAGKQFLSPTINTAFDGEDFIKFCENPKHYLECDFSFFTWPGHNYPLARLDDIEVRFVHYHSQDECIEKWKNRSKRIDWNHIYIIATDVDGMYQEKWMERFDKLPYKNKIMFTSKKFDNYSWAKPVYQFRNRNSVHILTDFANFAGQRYYETAFDIAKWIADSYEC